MDPNPNLGKTFQVTVTRTGDGEVRVRLPAGAVQSAAGLGNTASQEVVFAFDRTPPVASSVAGSPTTSSVAVTFSVSEAARVYCALTASASAPAVVQGTAGAQFVDVPAAGPGGACPDLRDSRWVHVSDHSVAKAGLNSVLTCEAYMLFYERWDGGRA